MPRTAPFVLPAEAAAAEAAVGSGCGTGSHCLSDRLPRTRFGSAPLSRYAAIVSSVQEMPLSEPACVVPPTPSMRTERGNRLRTSRLPGYGVAASLVSLISRIGGAFLPFTFTGLPASPFQNTHGALNQAL